MSLSIGIHSHGWHDGSRVIEDALGTIMRLVAHERAPLGISDQPGINVVYHLPGDLGSLDYVGIRTSTFSRKQRIMMIQVGVPEEVMNMADPSRFIFDSLKEAIDAATPRFERQGWMFSREDHVNFVDHVERVWRSRGGLSIQAP